MGSHGQLQIFEAFCLKASDLHTSTQTKGKRSIAVTRRGNGGKRHRSVEDLLLDQRLAA